MLSGDITVHKKVVQRPCKAVLESESGSLSVWDSLPEEWEWATIGNKMTLAEIKDDGTRVPTEPDVIASPGEWVRVEREGHYWDNTSADAVMEKARERDDVDEEDIDAI